MSADNEHPENGGVETRENGAIATSSERLVDLYREMVLIRAFEEACQRGFRQGKIGGYLHVYIGQEAVATGFLQAYKEGDKVITAYRDHAHALLLGTDPNEVMAELYGKGTGMVKGKGGSMHLFDVERGLMGGYGIVGGHIPLGVGFSYSMRYQETDHITQLYLGDGAIANGAFHEAANLAGLWGKDGMCPASFIIENNQYGMGTLVERTTAMTDLAAKFDAYGIENEKVDGMDSRPSSRRRDASRAGRETGQALRRRGPHLPDRLPRRRRLLREVPQQGRGRGVAQARPDRDARAQAARERRGSTTRSSRRSGARPRSACRRPSGSPTRARSPP
jgi:pyruvate dehydrogenase E1 component alpha subunit